MSDIEIIKSKALRELEKQRAVALRYPAEAHHAADQILCTFLVALGHEDLVEAYNRIQPKWYE